MRSLGGLRIAAAAALSGVLVVASAAFAATGFAHSSSAAEYQYNPAAAQYRLTICHYTHSKQHPMHTITISVRAWPAHERHGDTKGACTTADLATLTWVRQGHGWKALHTNRGKSGAHGNGHARGHSSTAPGHNKGK